MRTPQITFEYSIKGESLQRTQSSRATQDALSPRLVDVFNTFTFLQIKSPLLIGHYALQGRPAYYITYSQKQFFRPAILSNVDRFG